MSNFSLASKGAYTLVELLIAIVIMTILFGIGFLNYRDFSRRQTVISLSRKIKGDLAIARENAISGRKPSNAVCDSPNVLVGYNFRVVTNTNYVIEAVCSGGSVQIKSVDISSGLTIDVPSPNPIFFKVLSKGTNLSEEAVITLRQENTENTLNVYVSTTGEIR